MHSKFALLYLHVFLGALTLMDCLRKGSAVMHSKFALLYLRVPFGIPDLNALSAQRVYNTSVSAYGVCVLCLSWEFLCMKCEEEILLKLFEPIFRDS